MTAVTFDTLKFANTLKAAGVPDSQAEAQATAFAEVISANTRDLVTVQDLDRSEKKLFAEIARVERDLKVEIKLLRDDLERQIADARREAKQDLREFELRIDARFADIRGEMKLMRWMLGATVTGVVMIVGILLRFLVYRGLP